MERTTERVEVERVVEIAAAPATVWQFLTDPEKAPRWWGKALELDARPGGPYRVEVGSGSVVAGAFVEVEPPRRLVYTFGWEGSGELATSVPAGTTTVEIELEPTAGGTRLRLRHRDLPGAESAVAHGQGWEHYFGRLAVAAAGGDPGPDPWATGAMS